MHRIFAILQKNRTLGLMLMEFTDVNLIVIIAIVIALLLLLFYSVFIFYFFYR